MVTAGILIRAVPMVLTLNGQVSIDPLPALSGPQCRLAGGSNITQCADAAEASSKVKAAATVVAGLTDTVVNIDGAEASSEASRTDARKAVHTIQTGGTVSTWSHLAVIHIDLAVAPRETSQAVTRRLLRKPISILAQTTVFTLRPRDTSGSM